MAETWVINEEPDITMLINETIDFVDGLGNSYDYVNITPHAVPMRRRIHYDNTDTSAAVEVWNGVSGWIDQAYRTVIFDDSVETAAPALYAWFNSPASDGVSPNAVKQEEPITAIEYDLSELDLAVGHHSFTFVSQADGYEDADPSEAIGFDVWGVSIVAMNGTVTPLSKIYQGDARVVTVTSDMGYNVPESMTLQTGAEYAKIDAHHAMISLLGSELEANVVVTVNCINISQKLATPDLTIVGNIASWTEIAHASGYRLKADAGEPIETLATSYDLDDLDLVPGTHTIYVQAVGDGEYYTDSDWDSASYVMIPRLATPTTERDGDIIRITTDEEGATGFNIYLNGVLEDQIDR